MSFKSVQLPRGKDSLVNNYRQSCRSILPTTSNLILLYSSLNLKPVKNNPDVVILAQFYHTERLVTLPSDHIRYSGTPGFIHSLVHCMCLLPGSGLLTKEVHTQEIARNPVVAGKLQENSLQQQPFGPSFFCHFIILIAKYKPSFDAYIGGCARDCSRLPASHSSGIPSG